MIGLVTKKLKILDLTDGNLASHVQALEKINFLEIKNSLLKKAFNYL